LKSPLRTLLVVGARPNYMKVAPVIRAMDDRNRFDARLVHTGQHYDAALSDDFFRDLEIPPPDFFLDVGSASHAVQTARILERFEPVVLEVRPDLVLVAGDVNSTVGCSLAAVKLGVPVGHIEAGLRSGDRTMPEEINRIVTDSIADLLFTTSRGADEHLAREGVPRGIVHFVGNSMIDTLRRFEAAARGRQTAKSFGAAAGQYVLVTLHRPSNVDEASTLGQIVDLLQNIAERAPTLFPIHPRTQARLEDGGLWKAIEATKNLHPLPPQGYLDFVSLQADARVVLTDSGGVQEETTALGVPCLTLRPNTERPVTSEFGTNLLVDARPHAHLEALDQILGGTLCAQKQIPELWDGQAGPRIAEVCAHWHETGGASRVRSGL